MTSQSSDAGLDRFGFPISWAIEFRRLLVDFRCVDGARSPAKVDAMAAETAQINDETRALTTILDRGERTARTEAPGSVLWVVPFPVTTGGMRVQVDLANALAAWGWSVTIALLRGGERAQVVTPDGVTVTEATDASGVDALLPVRDFDVVIAGCWIDYLPMLEAGSRRLVGYSGGEPTINESEGFDDGFLAYRSRAHALPVRLVTCSRFVQGRYSSAMARESVYVPVALNDLAFAPHNRPRRNREDRFRVLLLARDGVVNKGLQFAIPALRNLQAEGLPVDIVWVTPSAPEIFVGVWCELHVNPPKQRLFDTVRSCDALLYTPLVDGLGLPPLEAMAAGTPVILTPTGGASEFAQPEVNCLQVQMRDTSSIEQAVKRLLSDPALGERLADSGRTTAVRYERMHTEDEFNYVIRSFLASEADAAWRR